MDPEMPPPPQKPRGNPAWVSGGASPNPSGRPKGIIDRRTRVTQALADDGPEIVRVVVQAALDGDMQAASLVLARITPTLRSQSQTVTFAFDPTGSTVRQVEQVLAAVAAGEVAPDIGKQIVDAIQSLSAVRLAEELEARIAQLEGRQT